MSHERQGVVRSGLSRVGDADPALVAEWRESFAHVCDQLGPEVASRMLAEVSRVAFERGVRDPARWLVDDLGPGDEVAYPGDVVLEGEIESVVRWNAMAMVQRANHASPGIGGHIATFAASSTALEVLRLHFLRGPEHPSGRDRVFFQGHASPGVYARALSEGRLDEALLDAFRRELPGPGLPSYPHPRLLPGFWEQPTVSMGLGPLTAIASAALDRFLFQRGLVGSIPRTVCFIGDGECDEPETLGALASAARLGLSNLVFVVVCNLQRLDGPTRGGSSSIAELSQVFSGAAWQVVRALWGSSWDRLFASPAGAQLAFRLSSLADGDVQRLSAIHDQADAHVVRDELAGGVPELVSLFADLPDEVMVSLLRDRAGHDRAKMFEAFSRAFDPANTVPSVVLMFCEKGRLLPNVESRNAAHQVKGLSADQLMGFRDRLGLSDVVPDEQCASLAPDYVRLSPTAQEYLDASLSRAGGSLPWRPVSPSPLPALADGSAFDEFDKGSLKEVSTTTAHTRLLKLLLRDAAVGPAVVPIVADEGRTFGFESLYAEFGVFMPEEFSYRSVDAHLPLKYQESATGRFVQVGISEAAGLAMLTAAGVSGFRGVPLLPVFEFYSMFGFQRVGDLIWAAVDAGASGVLVGATAGRTTLHGEGLQHADGHSLVWAQSVPDLWAFDPAFAFETASVYRSLLGQMATGVPTLGYVTVYNENFVQPARPDGVSDEEVFSGGYVFDDPFGAEVCVAFCGVGALAAFEARRLLAGRGLNVRLVSCPSVKLLVEDARRCELGHAFGSSAGCTCRFSQLTGGLPTVFVSDWVSQLAAPLRAHAPSGMVVLGTDGFGRSAERAVLRDHFQVSGWHVARAALGALGLSGNL